MIPADLSALHLLLLFGAGMTAGFLNVMAGGGSALTLPALIFMGLDSAVANGTNRLALIAQNASAVGSFRHHKLHDFPASIRMAVFTLPGAIIGALVAVRVGDELFHRVLGVVIIFIVISLFVSPANKKRTVEGLAGSTWLYPALFAIGFYSGFIQAGVGFLLIAALYHLGKMNLVRVNMHKVFIIFFNMVPTLLVFALNGKVMWFYGLVLAAGNALGAWWGAHAAVRGGEKIIRISISIALLLMVAKLFELF